MTAQTSSRATAEQLRVAIKRAGISTAEAARIMGVTGRSVRRYIAGTRAIPLAQYDMLRIVTGQHPDYGPREDPGRGEE